MKKLLLLTTLFLAFSCSKDEGDGDDNSNENQTFLEKYDGFGFYAGDEYADEYYFFYDSDVFLKYVDIDLDGETYCESVRTGITSDDGDSVEIKILKNDQSRLTVQVSYTYDGTTEIETTEFSIDSSGNNLTVLTGNDSEIYTKTTKSYSSLCN
jgi:hypothetical protein